MIPLRRLGDWATMDAVDIDLFVSMMAPDAPTALRDLAVNLLGNRLATSDHLLLVADAYTEAAMEVAFAGEGARPRATAILALAALLRERAPFHAEGVGE